MALGRALAALVFAFLVVLRLAGALDFAFVVVLRLADALDFTVALRLGLVPPALLFPRLQATVALN